MMFSRAIGSRSIVLGVLAVTALWFLLNTPRSVPNPVASSGDKIGAELVHEQPGGGSLPKLADTSLAPRNQHRTDPNGQLQAREGMLLAEACPQTTGTCRDFLRLRLQGDTGGSDGLDGGVAEADGCAVIRKSKCLESSATVVMAAATGYGPVTWRNFILPLRAVYDGDVIIFVDNFEKDVPGEIRNTLSEKRITVRLLLTGSPIGVKGNRYMTYADTCQHYDRCFATDFRDVLFQDNPFRDDTPDADLVLAQEFRSEQTLVGTCPYNSGWVRSCWPDVFQKIKEEYIM